MRIFLGLLVAALLGGCSNLVTSETPWFTSADEVGAHTLRSGLWTLTDRKCRFRERAPVELWPDCASAIFVRPGEAFQLSVSRAGDTGRNDISYDWSQKSYVLVAGDPQIEQVKGCPQPAVPEAEPDTPAVEGQPLTPSPATEPVTERPTTHQYCYYALRPMAFDQGGQITAYVAWPIFCGPWPKDSSSPPVTAAPFPGLHVDDYDCTADTISAIRAAAKLSESITPSQLKISAHWVREGYR